jgi:hypothetical protein
MDHLVRASLRGLNGLRGHDANATRPGRRPTVMLHM